jgi:hypothetical protein
MTWAQQLTRVFKIDIETCSACGGQGKVIACIEDPLVIEKLLAHLDKKAAAVGMVLLPQGRAPSPVCVQRTGRPINRFD